MFSRFTLTALAALTAISHVNADEILMKNGSRLVGDLISAEADKVIFDTPFAGKITIKQQNIERITTEEPVTLMMENGTIYRNKQITSTETAMLVESEDTKPVVFAAQDIKMVNPEPWKIGEGYDWTGRISLAIEYERGNSNSDEWHLKGKTVWRSLIDRYTLKGDKEYETSKGVKKEDNWFAYGKYDRFFYPGSKHYRGVNLSFEYDEFADLDLRTIVGVHGGRDFSSNPRFTLQMELGPAWVDERFNVAQDDDWLGIMWTATVTSDIVGFGSKLYLDHDGIFNTSDSRDTILNATVGIRFPIAGGFETALEAEFEYDGGAVENVKQLDETYTLNFGYSW